MSTPSEKATEEYKKERLRQIAHLQHRFILAGAWQTCLNCVEWSGEVCRKYNVTPPPDVLVVGCEGWFDVNDIPF